MNALSSSLVEYDTVETVSNDTWMRSNNVEANFCCFHRISVFGARFLMVENRFPQDASRTYPRKCDRPKQLISPMKVTYATTTSSSSRTTTSSCLRNEKTTIELDDVLEENYMTVNVKTTNGKTISTKCNRKQKAGIFQRKSKENHRSREA